MQFADNVRHVQNLQILEKSKCGKANLSSAIRSVLSRASGLRATLHPRERSEVKSDGLLVRCEAGSGDILGKFYG